MSALPAVVPTLKLLPTLTPAAAEAASVDPTTLIRAWLDSKSPTARRAYGLALRSFGTWALGDDAAAEATMRLLCDAGTGSAHSMVAAWRDAELARGLATGTVAGRCAALASLVRCCRRAGLCNYVLADVAPRVEPKHDRSGPTSAEVDRLLQAVDEAAGAGDVRAVRDAAVLRLLFCAGLRRSEAVGLRFPDDVDLATAVVRPRRKGKRERSPVTIGKATVASLARWIEARGSEAGPVFRATRVDADRSVALSGEAVRHLAARWARAAGIRRAVRPHGLRHAGATIVAERGDLASLMQFGQWASLSAASRYLDKREADRERALAIVDR